MSVSGNNNGLDKKAAAEYVAVHGGYEIYTMHKKKPEGEEDDGTGESRQSNIIILVVSPDGKTYVIDLDAALEEKEREREEGKDKSKDDKGLSPVHGVNLVEISALLKGGDGQGTPVTLMIDPTKLAAGLDNPMAPPDEIRQQIDPQQEQFQIISQKIEPQKQSGKSPGHELLNILYGQDRKGNFVYEKSFVGFDESPEQEEPRQKPMRGGMNYSLAAVGSMPVDGPGEVFGALLSDSMKTALGAFKGLGISGGQSCNTNDIGHTSVIGDAATAQAMETKRNEEFSQSRTTLPGQNT